jgi:hypothetical protein
MSIPWSTSGCGSEGSFERQQLGARSAGRTIQWHTASGVRHVVGVPCHGPITINPLRSGR